MKTSYRPRRRRSRKMRSRRRSRKLVRSGGRRQSKTRTRRQYRSTNENECAVCLEPLVTDVCTPYQCPTRPHPIHTYCAHRWKRGTVQKKGQCPTCRSEEKPGFAYSYIYIRRPTSYEDIIETIRFFPPVNVKVYFGPPFEDNFQNKKSYLLIDERLVVTEERQQIVIDELMKMSRLQFIGKGAEYVARNMNVVELRERKNQGATSFLRNALFTFLMTHEQDTYRDIVVYINFYWEWYFIKTLVLRNRNSLDYLHIANYICYHNFKYPLSDLLNANVDLPRLTWVELHGADMTNVHFTQLQRSLQAVVLYDYKYVNHESIALLKELGILKTFFMSVWNGWEGRGKDVFPLVVRAVRSNTVLEIKHCPSLFVQDDPSLLFNGLVDYGVTQVWIFMCNVQQRFDEWRQQQCKETKTLVEYWRVNDYINDDQGFVSVVQ